VAEANGRREAAAGDRIERWVWVVSFVVLIGSVMPIVDTTIVNIALATLSREFHSTISQIQWVVTGYTLALAAVIPVSGWAARRFGAKEVYLVSLVLFVLGSALCALSTSIDELILFRVLQGFGGGMIMPLGQLIMAHAAGPKRMGRVMSIVVVPVMLAPILGPTIGGLLIQDASWRWIFLVNVPIGIVGFIAGLRLVPHLDTGDAGKLDVRGLVLMGGGLALLTYGLAEIGTLGTFGAAKVLLPGLAGLALVGLFVFFSFRTPRPLLDLRLYRRSTFSSASIAMFCLSAALFGGQILLPLYWQDIRHESVIDAGLLMAPMGLGAALSMPLAGKLATRYGGGPIALIGVTITAVLTIPFGFIGAHTSIVWLSAVSVVRGTGIGFGFMPAMTAAFAALKRSELSDATPQLNVQQRVGGSIGVALLAVVLQRALVGAHTLPAMAAAYGTAFWASALLAGLAIIPCVVLMRAERAARAAKPEVAAEGAERALEAAAA
jgi:EmrB/QacA subfamily drug resistance transporter